MKTGYPTLCWRYSCAGSSPTDDIELNLVVYPQFAEMNLAGRSGVLARQIFVLWKAAVFLTQIIITGTNILSKPPL